MCPYTFVFRNRFFPLDLLCPCRWCCLPLPPCPFWCPSLNISPTPNPTVKRLSSSSWSSMPHRAASSSDERYTPLWVLELAVKLMGGIDLDPCADPLKRVPAALHYTKEQDGLSRAWAGRVFLNPPYSGATAWFKHLCLYMEAGAVSEALVLVPVTSIHSKGAALLMKQFAAALCLCYRRFNFLDADYKDLPVSTPIPLALVYAGGSLNRFLELTRRHGYGLMTHKPPSNRRQVSCSYCGDVFFASRSTARFCGTTCRVEAHRKKAQGGSVV